MRQISKDEVKNHVSENDCWIIAYNKVYDVSKFMHIHPGSKNAIFKNAGKDVSIDYNFHSNKSKKIWKELCIGYIKKEDSCCCIT